MRQSLLAASAFTLFSRRTAGRSPRAQRGFSMAEVLVAIALLSVIILAVFGLITAGVRRAYGGKKMTEGTVLAEAVMERANIVAPQALLGAVDTDTTATVSWNKSANTHLDSSVTPAAESNPSSLLAITERNAWRALLRDTDLPSTASSRSMLTVTMTALPSGRNFGNAALVRVQVDVVWTEFGNRRRQVRLQTLNVRSNSV